MDLFDHQTNEKESETMKDLESPWNGNECKILKERLCSKCRSKVKEGMLVSDSDDAGISTIRFLCFTCWGEGPTKRDDKLIKAGPGSTRKDDELSERLDKAYASEDILKISSLEGGTLFIYNGFDWIRASKSIIAIQAVRVKDGLVATFNHDDKYDKLIWHPPGIKLDRPLSDPQMLYDTETGVWEEDDQTNAGNEAATRLKDILSASIDALEESVFDVVETLEAHRKTMREHYGDISELRESRDALRLVVAKDRERNKKDISELRGGLVDALKAIETISRALLNADKEGLVSGIRAVVRDFLLRRFTILGEL